jgi:pimeloyl-ACP methyl ester carboxylesterase
MGLGMLLTLTLVRFMSLFVDQAKYEAKVAAIPSMEAKHAGFDLEGWEYLSAPARNGDYVHRYYRYASQHKDAPTLLFIHGLNLDGRTFMRLKPLAKDWTLVAYDLPERCPLYKGSFDDFRAVLDDFVAQYPDSLAGVGGVSFGGGPAMHLAANNPRLKNTRLMLISTTMVNASKQQRDQTRAMNAWVSKMPDYKLYWVMETMVARSAKDLIADSSETGRNVLTVLGLKHPDFYRQVARSMGSYMAPDDARKVTCPTLMLMGTRDDLFKTEQDSMMRAFIPQLEYEIVPGGTHSMAFQRGEEVSRHIDAFLRRHSFSSME